MAQHPPLTAAEKELIVRLKHQNHTLPDIATELGVSVMTVRKWWRRSRDYGQAGLLRARPARGANGPCSQFPPGVRDPALALRHAHPRWGALRVRLELQRDPSLCGIRLPSPSRLAALFKAACPELLGAHRPRPQPRPAPPVVRAVHEVWQLDTQEALRLANGERASICTIRDPLGAVIIASQCFVVTTLRGWRKLTFAEVRQVLRAGFAEWGTLPDAVQTDNELGLGGSPTDPFPSELSQYLAGLGVAHRFIRPHQPTDQAAVERTHRTLAGFVCSGTDLADEVSLQAALARERQIYNSAFPARASDCAGRAPLVAHPQLRQPRRPYPAAGEEALFELQRVYDLLANLELTRKVNTSGQVSVGRQVYSVGRRWAGQEVRVHCDAGGREWIFSGPQGEEVARRAVQGVSEQRLTGPDPAKPKSLAEPVQLSLPLVGLAA
jgi:transposase InsO family protein